MKTIFSFLLAASAACGCENLNLLDEMVPFDTDTAAGPGDSSGGGPDGSGGDIVDAPPDGLGGDAVIPATDTSDDTAPQIATLCLSHESASASACVCGGVQSALVRFVSDEGAALTVTDCPAQCLVRSPSFATEHLVLVYGAAVVDGLLRVEAADVNGNSATLEVSLSLAEGPAVAIVEVLADPAGEEPLQEFVEIVNYGATEVDVSGWMIDDGGDGNGDLLPGGAILPSGATAVIAQTGFDPGRGGVTVFAIDSSIGTSGLKNSESESVELYDAAGLLVSSFATALTPREDCSIVRVHPAMPSIVPDLWMYAEGGDNTPGW